MLIINYSEDQSSGTYRMVNPVTAVVRSLRDITWPKWRRPDLIHEMNIFKQDPMLLREPIGIKDNVYMSVIPPDHPDDDDSNAKAGRNSASKCNDEAGRNEVGRNTQQMNPNVTLESKVQESFNIRARAVVQKLMDQSQRVKREIPNSQMQGIC